MGASLHYFYQDFHHEHQKSLRRHDAGDNSPGYPADNRVQAGPVTAAGLFCVFFSAEKCYE